MGFQIAINVDVFRKRGELMGVGTKKLAKWSLAAILLLAPACVGSVDEQGGGGSGEPPIDVSLSLSTFNSEVLPSLNDDGCLGCHNGGVAQNLGTHENLLNSNYVGLDVATSPFVNNVTAGHGAGGLAWSADGQAAATNWATVHFDELMMME